MDEQNFNRPGRTNKTIIIVLLVVVLLAAGAVAYFNLWSKDETAQNTNDVSSELGEEIDCYERECVKEVLLASYPEVYESNKTELEKDNSFPYITDSDIDINSATDDLNKKMNAICENDPINITVFRYPEIAGCFLYTSRSANVGL
ncbi:MAG: hypothetical protein V1838_05650 [Patescibacteria group bacterium]